MGRGESEGLSHVEIVHAGSEAQWLKYGMSNASKNPFVLGQSEALYGHSLGVMMEILNE